MLLDPEFIFCDIDTLKCVIFCTILCDLLLFLKNSLMHVINFLPNLDLLELLGVFIAICHLNQCLVFGMLF